MLRNDDVIEALPRITLEWLAGFFDGEGSVIVQLSYDLYANAGITITQKDPKILFLIMMKYGGDGELNAYTGANNAKCARWRVRGKTAEKFLKDIAPFVIVKRRQVEKALQLISLIGKSDKTSLETRKTLMEEIKVLNKEGNVSGE